MTDSFAMGATASDQAASAVLMVRPAAFGWNRETAPSNRFQAAAPVDRGDVAQCAVAEFAALATALTQSGVTVHAVADRDDPSCPDAVFPNNWVSMHADGTVVLYPMLAASRRHERRLDVLVELAQRGGYRVERLLDLTHHELHGRYLEGTGSVVFDHVARLAYACLSPRTDVAVLDELCAELGYAPVTFTATDRAGVPVYHTNVALSIGAGYALLCAAAVPTSQRGALLERLAAHGRRVLTIDHAQMEAFAGNVLELRGAGGTCVLAGSQRAFASLSPALHEALASCSGRIVAVPVPTIEALGGGSVRCMLAEVFLPSSKAPTPVTTTGADT
ncbi:MAG: arginine deiminase-related protein [Steroidobacteraceae bacterium]|nr:arginine deiminase-related protein [Steroidobacteraceae bacterium]